MSIHVSNNVRDRSIYCIYGSSDGIRPRLVLSCAVTVYRNCKPLMKSNQTKTDIFIVGRIRPVMWYLLYEILLVLFMMYLTCVAIYLALYG